MQETVQDTLAGWGNYPSFQGSDNVVYALDNDGNRIETIQPQASAVVVENETGYLRAIVGSREEPDRRLTFNRAYEGDMQIGSSIKPLAVYGPAFDIGYSLASNIANIPAPVTGWEVTDSDPGYPQTSQGEYGPVSLHQAIVNSLNISAARTVADLVTLPTSAKYLQQLGVDPVHIDETITGLSLGVSPVTPIEVAGAYSVIPRSGEYLQPVSFTLVRDSRDETVIDIEESRERRQGFRQTTAWMLNTALEDAVDHGTGTNADIEGMTTAGKTGTVVQNKGAFFAGYTPYYTSALWIGHDKFKAFDGGGTGGSVCAPLWKEYMTKIHEGLPDKEIYPGDPGSYGMVEGQVCKYSNMKLTPNCTPSETDWIAAGDLPIEECTICGAGGSGVTYCLETGMLATEYCPSTYYGAYPLFPESSPYYGWFEGGGLGAVSEYCTVHTADWYWSVMLPPEPSEEPVQSGDAYQPITPNEPGTGPDDSQSEPDQPAA
jgi:penicillin-binding protein 1A